MLSGQIDGMGLVNVYVRLKLFYGDDMIYLIVENKGLIVIGRMSANDDGQDQNKNHHSGR